MSRARLSRSRVIEIPGIALRLITVLGLAVLTVLVAAMPALALEWLAGGKKISNPHGDGVLLRAVGEHEELRFSDNTLGVSIECAVGLTGTAGPGTADSITGVDSGLNCKVVSEGEGRCSSGETVGLLDTPWKTLLVEASGLVEDDIEPATGGQEPRFRISCTGFEDTCSAQTAMIFIENAPAGVLMEFAGTPTTCGLGIKETERKGAGEIKGYEQISGCPQMSVVK